MESSEIQIQKAFALELMGDSCSQEQKWKSQIPS